VTASPRYIAVELVYAEPQRAVVKVYRVAVPATIADVLALAAADREFAGLVSPHAAVGVFGRRADLGQRLEEGDRIEIYRPLAADPKIERRLRARNARLKTRPKD
jgi:putative ubiquitin-RnfH superfamily antitoxin RatB of RatAB toxin-antitoxin module